MGRVDGKVALISGGAWGMGAAHARLLAAEGACVVIGDLLDDERERLADELAVEARYARRGGLRTGRGASTQPGSVPSKA